jgi:hypothetical protein
VADVEYRERPEGIHAMLAAPFMVEALRQVAERGKVGAERNTPVDTGRMKASWHVWHGLKDGRAAAQIFNTATNPQSGFHYPWVVENGAHNQPRQRPLGRAIDEMTIRH